MELAWMACSQCGTVEARFKATTYLSPSAFLRASDALSCTLGLANTARIWSLSSLNSIFSAVTPCLSRMLPTRAVSALSTVAPRLADICTAGWRWKRLGTAYSTPKASTTMTSAYLQRGKSLMRRTCQNHGRDAAKTRRQPPPSPAQADFNVPLGNTWAID